MFLLGVLVLALPDGFGSPDNGRTCSYGCQKPQDHGIAWAVEVVALVTCGTQFLGIYKSSHEKMIPSNRKGGGGKMKQSCCSGSGEFYLDDHAGFKGLKGFRRNASLKSRNRKRHKAKKPLISLFSPSSIHIWSPISTAEGASIGCRKGGRLS